MAITTNSSIRVKALACLSRTIPISVCHLPVKPPHLPAELYRLPALRPSAKWGGCRIPARPGNNLAKYGERAVALARKMRLEAGGDKELIHTLGDIEALGHLGQYYAAKIHGAAEIALFDKSGDEQQRARSLAHLRRAVRHWLDYASAYTRQYRQPVLYNRVGWIDVNKLTDDVQRDVLIAQLWRVGTADEIEAGKGPADNPFRQ